MSKQYTVWVGGGEINSFYLTLQQAELIAQEYIDNDYEDVTIQKVVIL